MIKSWTVPKRSNPKWALWRERSHKRGCCLQLKFEISLGFASSTTTLISTSPGSSESALRADGRAHPRFWRLLVSDGISNQPPRRQVAAMSLINASMTLYPVLPATPRDVLQPKCSVWNARDQPRHRLAPNKCWICPFVSPDGAQAVTFLRSGRHPLALS